jgi:hypothetical protein
MVVVTIVIFFLFFLRLLELCFLDIGDPRLSKDLQCVQRIPKIACVWIKAGFAPCAQPFAGRAFAARKTSGQTRHRRTRKRMQMRLPP